MTRKREATLLKNEIMKNTVITANPTLTTSSNNSNDESGLYSSTATNTGEPTYYFRGNVENNYVSFAGFTWRIVRINEDGTIKIIMQDGINSNAKYKFSSNYYEYTSMYYTNSLIKSPLENWYQENIGSKSDLASSVATGDYYCEQAKVKHWAYFTSGQADMIYYKNYTPDFKCSSDGNGKGVVNASVGLLTYDEVIYAGAYFQQANKEFFLNSSTLYGWWTMSPDGVNNSLSHVWIIGGALNTNDDDSKFTSHIRPVLVLKADTLVMGDGTSSDPFVVQ